MPTEVVTHGSDTDYVAPGIYEHFKGNQYRVLGIATHSETEEGMVLYEPLSGATCVYARPLHTWNDKVRFRDEIVPRFRWLEPCEYYYTGRTR